MIKFFQKLKAKKGFTLVELIVVIAIIGVLAAILVPTMLGYVTSSRVTSANSTAASLAKQIDAFLTSADTAGYGMKRSNTNVDQIEIEVKAGQWTITSLDTTQFKSITGGTWSQSNSVKGVANAAKSTAAGDATALLAIELATLFPDVKSGYIYASLKAGKCVALAYTADIDTQAAGNAGISDVIANIETAGTDAQKGCWKKTSLAWDGTTAGVSSNGYIVGTAPTLSLSTGC